MVDANNSDMTNTFAAHTAMGWLEFLEKATSHLDKPSDDAESIWYRFGGKRDKCTLIKIGCESDWGEVMDALRQRALAAKWIAVSIQVQNTVSDALSRWK